MFRNPLRPIHLHILSNRIININHYNWLFMWALGFKLDLPAWTAGTLTTMLSTQPTRYLLFMPEKKICDMQGLEWLQNYLSYSSVVKHLTAMHWVLNFILSTKNWGRGEDDILEHLLSGLSEMRVCQLYTGWDEFIFQRAFFSLVCRTPVIRQVSHISQNRLHCDSFSIIWTRSLCGHKWQTLSYAICELAGFLTFLRLPSFFLPIWVATIWL